jgi:hypothetical protein
MSLFDLYNEFLDNIYKDIIDISKLDMTKLLARYLSETFDYAQYKIVNPKIEHDIYNYVMDKFEKENKNISKIGGRNPEYDFHCIVNFYAVSKNKTVFKIFSEREKIY